MKKSKTKKTASERLKQFPDCGLEIRSDKLWCPKCNEFVAHDRKDTISKHLYQAKKHIGWVDGAASSMTLKSDGALLEFSTQWDDLAHAAVKSGIPINVFENEHMRNWIKKYVKNGHRLPCQKTLRTKLHGVGNDDLAQTIELCRGKEICMVMDETIDSLARKVLNILVRPLTQNSRFRLLTTKFLETVDSTVIAQSAIEALNKLDIPFNNFLVFVSDNAPYMVSAAHKLSGICTRLMHTTCWSHVLHLVSEELRNSMEFADKLISSMKKALLKCPTRKTEYLACMQTCGKQHKLPPTPVLTRWATWLEAGDFHWKNFEVLQKWIESTGDKGPVVSQIKLLLKDHGEILAQQLERVSAVYPGLSKSIKYLEGDSVPACLVWSVLQQIKNLLKNLGVPSDKLSLCIEQKHPAKQFWEDAQILDPRYWPENINEGIPVSLKKFAVKPLPIEELIQYRTLSDLENSRKKTEIDVMSFWIKFCREMPNFSELALKALCVPSSSASVERSFSYLKKLLAPQRSRFTEENLDIHMRVVFNEVEFQLIPVDDSDDDE